MANHLHRVAILSRNLTFDRSWDTALVLDEDEAGVIDAEPAAAFVEGLPALSLRPARPRAKRRDRQPRRIASQGPPGRPGAIHERRADPDRHDGRTRLALPRRRVSPPGHQPILDQTRRRRTEQGRHRQDTWSPARNRSNSSALRQSTGGTSTCCNDWRRSTLETTSPISRRRPWTVSSKPTTAFTRRHSSSTRATASRPSSREARTSPAQRGARTSSSMLFSTAQLLPAASRRCLNGSPEAPGLSRILEEYTRHRRGGG